MLNTKQFVQAMEILTAHHSNKVEINRVAGETVKEGKNNIRLEILDCVPSVINKLKEADFMVGMKDGRLTVDKLGND